MYDLTLSEVPSAQQPRTLPRPPSTPDAIDRMDFSAVYVNEVTLPG